MTIFHVFELAGIGLGLYWGAYYGHAWYGIPGAIAGAVLGIVVGFFAGKIPFLIAWCSLGIERKSTEELREIFKQDQYYIFHLALAALMARGEDVTPEKPRILDLLLSDASDRRRFGWGSLQVAFPELAAQLPEFDPEHPSQDHLDKIRAMKAAG